ncbi:gluconokinase [Paenibacillus sp. EPM92]|uniref:gluconokinase n=1 Tax=Paenibacillus sp. EPM92 TaxID=1561195 RepID=UPI00191558EC|nr:gluconokinase [Paenibacillus sp. EPM92]
MRVFVGLDIGTTSTKAVAFGVDGAVASVHSVPYPLICESPGYAEQDPGLIVEAAAEAVSRVTADVRLSHGEVAAVSLSSAMHSLLVVDDSGRPLTRLMTWADNRSAEQAKRIAASGGLDIYKRTGTPIHAMSPLSKLFWLRENRPDLYEKAGKFVSIKEYLLYRLFGQFVIDHSLASATGLYRLGERDWDKELLRDAGIRRDQLSELHPVTCVMTGLNPGYAKRMGLSTDVPFVLGASDGVLANLGVGAIDPGDLAVTVGTSGAVRTVVDRPLTSDRQQTFCYVFDDRHWVIGGGTNNGGIVLDWVQTVLHSIQAPDSGKSSLEGMLRQAERIPPGAEGLLFLPYLSGERAPIWNPNARGVFLGLNLTHSGPHLARSAMEGMMMSLLSVALAMHDLTGLKNKVLASGGFARSPFLLQLLSDVFGCDVEVPACAEASAYGAAFLGMMALGEYDDIRDIKSTINMRETYVPCLKHHQVYTELYRIYEQAYAGLGETFEAITALQHSLQGAG